MERILYSLLALLAFLVLPIKVQGGGKEGPALCEKLALNQRTPLKSNEYLINKNSRCLNLMNEELSLNQLYFYFVDDSDENLKCAFLSSLKLSKERFDFNLRNFYHKYLKNESQEGFKVLCDEAVLVKKDGFNPTLWAPGLECAKQPYGGWNCTESLLESKRIY